MGDVKGSKNKGKRAEEVLRQSEERFRQMVDLLPEAVCEFDTSGNILFGNRAAFIMVGYDEADFKKGLNIMPVIAPEDQERAFKNIQGMMAGEAMGADEYTLVRKDGSRFPATVHIANILNASGKTVGFRGIVVDITERKRAERYQALSAEIPNILNESVALTDAIGRILDVIKRETGFDAVGIRLRKSDDYPYFVQNGFSEDFLLTENTLVARGPDGGICRDENGNVSLECTCGLVISGKTDPSNPLFTRGGSAWTNDALPILDLPLEQDPRLHPRNRCIHVGFQSVALIPIRANKEIVGLLQLNDRRKGCFTLETIRFFEEIAASIGIALMRKQTEEVQQRLAAIVTSSHDAIIGKTLDGIITSWNEGAEMHYGYSADEAIGRPISMLVPPERADEVPQFLEKIGRGEAVRDYETVRVAKDGRRITALLSISPIRDASGNVVGASTIAQDITERKRMEDALRESEEKLRLTFESIADGIIIIDLKGNVVDVNEATLQIGGYKNKGQLIGTDAFDLIAPKDRKMVMDDLKDRIEGRPKDRMEYSIYPKGGRAFEAELTASTLHDENGNPIGYIAVVRDITERKRAEEALLESEKKYRTLFEDSIDAVIISTIDGKILDVNDSLLSLTGYGRDELLSMNAIKLYANPADREMFAREIEETGSVKEYGVKWVKKNGKEIDVVMTLAARRDEGGKIIGYQGIVRDVTERKRLEASLQRSEKRFRELADFLPQTICEIDLNGRFTYANRYGIEAHGYTKEEIEKSLNAIDLFIPVQRDRVVQSISRVLSGQKFDDHEYSVLRKDGSTYPALIYANAIVCNGQVAGVRALVVDITERKKVEQMKTNFVSFISHQLRTPVAGLMAYIDNMLDGVTGALNDMQVDYLREMRGVCARNNQLIADLLNISRLERGVLAVNIAPVDLRSVVDIAVKEHRSAIEEKGLALNLGGMDRETMVLADSDKLVEVLKNVVHNAAKFTDKGSITIEIVSDAQCGIIKVRDTGMGMPRAVLQGLFTKERVFGGAIAVGGGAGLGLYIAKGFMHLQHGDITAESVEGKGSTFSISLPRK